MTTTFVTWANYQEGASLLSPLIQEIANEFEKQVGLDDEASKIWVVKENPLTPNGKITSMAWPEPLQEINEDEEAPLLTLTQWFEKGYEMKSYARKHKITKVFKKWIEQGAQIQGADSSVKQELNRLKDAIAYLVEGAKLTLNEQFTRVLAEWFAVTAPFGPGSASPDGVSLFNATHLTKKTWITYDNTIAGAITSDVAVSRASILAAIQKYKTGIRTLNGYRVKTPNVFTLLVPRALETYARMALNTAGSQSGIYSWVGTNAAQLNVFSFEGSMVEIQVLDMLWEYDLNGVKIGWTNADTMWFLMNKELATKVKAFRIFTLWWNEMKMFTNDETDAMFVKLDTHFWVEHFNPETVMWYPGA